MKSAVSTSDFPANETMSGSLYPSTLTHPKGSGYAKAFLHYAHLAKQNPLYQAQANSTGWMLSQYFAWLAETHDAFFFSVADWEALGIHFTPLLLAEINVNLGFVSLVLGYANRAQHIYVLNDEKLAELSSTSLVFCPLD